MDIYVASSNKNKVKEIKEILEIENIFSISDLKTAGIIPEKYIDPVETGDTFEENARIKAQALYSVLKDGKKADSFVLIADDSGLSVDFLDGAPGVFSSRYGGVTIENGIETPLLNDREKCEKLLEELDGVPEELRGAKFICVIFCIISEARTQIREFSVQGEFCGEIGNGISGENGFGYDPIFVVDGKNLAEMTAKAKNSISHRRIAIEELKRGIEG